MPDLAALDFERDGARLFPGAINACLVELEFAVAGLPCDEVGLRLRGVTSLDPYLAATGCIGRIADAALGGQAKPVRAILFNKSAEANWSLAWHQDRTICVRERLDVPGFGPWSVKRGMQHVEPPFALSSRMITLRAHFDAVPATNAPLLIAPGSHKLGRIPFDEVGATVRRCGTAACLADAGDVWLYATPILHASEAASVPTRRRVLQVDYSADDLPAGLEWLGV